MSYRVKASTPQKPTGIGYLHDTRSVGGTFSRRASLVGNAQAPRRSDEHLPDDWAGIWVGGDGGPAA
jgi:hypothetical protein